MRLALTIAALLVVSPGTSAFAGTIGFRTDAKVTAGPGVDVNVTLTHTGDEAASDVSLRAELDEKAVDGDKVASIAPGQNRVWDFHLADRTEKGVYAVVLRARYADSNGYNFEIISTAAAPVGVTPAARLFGSLDVPRLTVGGETTAKLNAKKPPERSGTYDVRLIAPSGLKVEPERLTLEFDAAGKATADFRVRNLGLLAGTTVNLFALITGDDAGFPQTDTIRGTARVTAATTRVTHPMFYEAAAAVLLLLAFLEVYSRMTRPAASE